MLTVTGTGAGAAATSVRSFSATARAAAEAVSGSSIRNSSPPSRPSWSSARRCAHRADGRDQDLVADVMAVLVVDRLEGVEVEDPDRERVAVTAGAADHAGELDEDRAPVRQPGQRVLAQQRLQAQALGDELVLEVLG